MFLFLKKYHKHATTNENMMGTNNANGTSLIYYVAVFIIAIANFILFKLHKRINKLTPAILYIDKFKFNYDHNTIAHIYIFY